MKIKIMTLNPFQMNTYILYDDTNEAIIIDPGNSTFDEDSRVVAFIRESNLHLVGVYITHCHIDHIPGILSLFEEFDVKPSYHRAGISFLSGVENSSYSYGIRFRGNVEPDRFLEDGDIVKFGRQQLNVLYTPGHADGSVCFYSKSENTVFVGDVLFNGSIGRTDLPTGDFKTLENSIRQKLYTLPDETIVYSGHGQATSIGQEKKSNPYFKA